jgi:acetamidase/formamidase
MDRDELQGCGTAQSGNSHRCVLSGCGDALGTGVVPDAALDELYRGRTRDRLEHAPEIERGTVEEFLAARSRDRRAFLRTGGLLGLFAAAGSLFSRLARADDRSAPLFPRSGGGKVHVVESTPETVRLGVFDTTLPNIVEIEPGDTVVYPKTWSHFLNKLQPGVPVEELARLRLANPGKGPHSMIGPVGVKGAEPGDVIEVQFLSMKPYPWAATFNNPGSLGTGALPDLFADGHVKYVKLDLERMRTKFNEDIELSLAPFQGTFGVAPPDGFFNMTNGVVTSVPPGPHGGNMDLREMNAGTRLLLPVWRPGAKIYTGDSHALQGDGEVNLTALETAMQEVRIRVLLHKRVDLKSPFVETGTHWIAMGMDKDLGVAQRMALLNAIDFLSRRAGLSREDAYALCSVGVSFRVTQVVDVNKGVHAMIPKSIFNPRLAAKMAWA